MRGVVIDRLVGGPEPGGGGVRLTGAGVAGIAGEGTAGDLDPDAVTALETVGGGP